MTTRIIDRGWGAEILAAAAADRSMLRVVSPFIKEAALRRLLALHPSAIEVITRFSLADFAAGVSDIAALRALLDAGARIRGIRHLHSKLYLFGNSQTIVTSANLTSAAMDRNQEFGLVSDDPELVAASTRYFADLWQMAGTDLSADRLQVWSDLLASRLPGVWRPEPDLPDFGIEAGFAKSPLALPTVIAEAERGFVKFLGEGDNRVTLSHSTMEELRSSGAHWAVAYPRSKRPRQVLDGDLIFVGRLTYDPNDIIVFGRAVGRRHIPGRDDATADEIALRAWKATWPRYVRVTNAEFVSGTLANGVSLNDLMRELESASFAATERNAIAGEGNTDPRKAYRQQPAVQLSSAGLHWLSERLQARFDSFGKISEHDLATLDWPLQT